MIILIKYPKFTVYFAQCVYHLTQVPYQFLRNKITKMNVVMFEISTANSKEYTLLFYCDNLFMLIRKYLASLEKLTKKYLLPTDVLYIYIYIDTFL